MNESDIEVWNFGSYRTEMAKDLTLTGLKKYFVPVSFTYT